MATMVSQAALISNDAEGRLFMPVSLASPMRRSALSRTALEGFQVGDVGFGVVGNEDLVAAAVNVGEGVVGRRDGNALVGRSSGSRPASPTGRPGR